jgi:hypothetical protein
MNPIVFSLDKKIDFMQSGLVKTKSNLSYFGRLKVKMPSGVASGGSWSKIAFHSLKSLASSENDSPCPVDFLTLLS